jgi:hypothetical protein
MVKAHRAVWQVVHAVSRVARIPGGHRLIERLERSGRGADARNVSIERFVRCRHRDLLR